MNTQGKKRIQVLKNKIDTNQIKPNGFARSQQLPSVLMATLEVPLCLFISK